MKTCGGGIASLFLTSTVGGGEWPASRPGRFTPAERVPFTHWVGGWAVPRVGLVVVEKRKILYGEESNPGRPARRYTD
jgi:hypothetical protein